MLVARRCNVVLLLLLLAGCATFNFGSPQDQLVAGYASVTAIRQVSIRLLNQDRLTAEQGQASVEIADEARVFLDSAAALVKGGKDAEALPDIQLARGVLDRIETYLRTKEAKK